MEALKILIADDEPTARELIQHYLSLSGIIYDATEVGDGLNALHFLGKEKPDILFLDIKMPELNGIEVLNKREASPLPAIIFTTAFDEYAIPAFDYEATDYLLKPFEKDRFDKALQKAARYVDFIKKSARKKWLTEINVRKGTRTIIIPINEIEYFSAEGPYIEACTSDKNWLLNNPLYEMEATLDPLLFQRIHRSLIVNFDYVKEINSQPNGDFIVKLKNGKELKGSRTYKARIKSRFSNK